MRTAKPTAGVPPRIPERDRKTYGRVQAEVPKAEMMDYPIALRASTQGRGSFTFYFTRYDEVPGNVAQKIIEEAKKAQA